jgi:geranylgeranyl diphosphate synthase type II
VDAAAYLGERAALVDRQLERWVPSADTPPERLHAAMRHLLFPGGKRLRPVLALAAAEAVGGAPEAALPVAAAVELVHTYSLVHDDLPCMDDDAERRGRPTVHVVYGEAEAVLAGDALLALAFEVAAAAEASAPGRALAAVRELAAAAGSRALVGGQSEDLRFAAGEGGAEAVLRVHERKTGALFAAATAAGALLAGAGEGQVGALRRFGRDLGVAFQIADDLLDAGRPESCSLVAALGADGARRRAEALLDGALALVEDWGERAEPLRECARFAVRRER